MRRKSQKTIAFLLAVLTLASMLCTAPFSAVADVTDYGAAENLESTGLNIWADPEGVLSQQSISSFSSGDKLAALGGIRPYRRSSALEIGGDSDYYLFLPSTADCTSLVFWFNGTASVNSTSLTSGVATDVFSEINEGGVSKTYTLKIGSSSYNLVAMKSSDVATVYIDTQSGSISSVNASKDNSETGSIMVVQPDGTVDYNGVLSKFAGRGNGTWSGTKKPYNIKLAASTSLLGMNKAKKWCLLANEGDETLVKNQMTYDFANYIGIKYQPLVKPVDLYVNQQYIGAYNLAEKVEIKSNRIDISDAYESLEIANGTYDEATGITTPADLTGTKVETVGSESKLYFFKTYDWTGQNIGAYKYSKLTSPSDVTGGYLYELEISRRWVEENAGFCAYNRQGWVIKNCDYASEDMIKYSYDLLYALGSSVYNNGVVPDKATATTCSKLGDENKNGSKSVTNPAPAAKYQGKKWSDLLDADSAVIYYWTQEFFKNMDSATSSTYFYKDSDSVDGMLYAGPMWDMDNSLVPASEDGRWGLSLSSPEGWYTKSARIYRWRQNDGSKTYETDDQSPLNFYAALATNCSDFWKMAEKSWYTTISPAVDVLLGNKSDESGKLKAIDEYIDTVKNSAAMNAYRWQQNDDNYNADSIKSRLKTWVSERQTWINNEIGQTDISTASIAPIATRQYTGSEITPEPVVTASTGETLVKGVDYTLSYSNNVGVGTATVTVTGINLYKGSVSAEFDIEKANLTNCSLTIDESAYKNTQLTAEISNETGSGAFSSEVTYQWYRNSEAIDGETASTYLTKESDAGAVITVTATGDGGNVTGSVTSNGCTVLSGEKPDAMTKAIALWDYDYSLDDSTLASMSDTEYVYAATGGVNRSSSTLTASVNAADKAKIKWSGTADLYKNDSTSTGSTQSPIMGTSKTDGLAWGEYPYFEATVSTAGYEKLKFSAKLGCTKKGPSSWKLQYSLDGVNYTDIDGAEYAITANKTMQLAFDNVSLPEECDNQLSVHIRMIVSKNIAFNGTNTIVGQTSGDASVNNIMLTGSTLSVITSLYEPTITATENNVVFDDDPVVVTDNNGGAEVYYSVNGGEYSLYTAEVYPFDTKTAKSGDTATISAYSKFNDITSKTASLTVTYGGTNINSFDYEDYSKDVTAGAVQSTSGTYGQSGAMTAYTDGASQYVPLWNDANKAFCVAPDDGAKWSDQSGFTYKVSTVGFDNVTFSAKAYSTALGPNSVTLQYSTDGETYYNVKSDVTLAENGVLEQAFLTTALPAACANQRTVYVRLATTENLTNSGAKLHDNESKGNLYVNDVVIAGDDLGEYKMPYTNKSTHFFGDNGTITFYSPDNAQMKYAVMNASGSLVLSGAYPQGGIKLTDAKGFDKTKQEPYSVAVWVEEDEEASIASAGVYYYKGDTVVKFSYNGTTRLFENYAATDSLSVKSTGGANSGTLSMCPNGTTPTALSYTGTYGVKASYSADNKFTATKKLDNPSKNGYWLAEVSTLGYKNLTLNLEQLSSNKGPRDWGVAYSTDGSSYTYIENSNARAISNDSSGDTVETYGNLVLPSECDNLEKLYIKIFINGGETVDGTELDDATLTKGNTGLNKLEISGTQMSTDVNITTTVLENKTDKTGSIAWGGVDIYVDGVYRTTSSADGTATVSLPQNSTAVLTFKGENVTQRTAEVAVGTQAQSLNAPLLVFEVTGDGFINAKDYSVINKNSKYAEAKKYFINFVNTDTSGFVYK